MQIVTLSLEEFQQEVTKLLDARLAPVLRLLNTSQAHEPDYLTTQQALALLHLSKPTLHKLRREGQITSYNSSDKRVLYKRAELVAYLEASKRKEAHPSC